MCFERFQDWKCHSKHVDGFSNARSQSFESSWVSTDKSANPSIQYPSGTVAWICRNIAVGHLPLTLRHILFTSPLTCTLPAQRRGLRVSTKHFCICSILSNHHVLETRSIQLLAKLCLERARCREQPTAMGLRKFGSSSATSSIFRALSDPRLVAGKRGLEKVLYQSRYASEIGLIVDTVWEVTGDARRSALH